MCKLICLSTWTSKILEKESALRNCQVVPFCPRPNPRKIILPLYQIISSFVIFFSHFCTYHYVTILNTFKCSSLKRRGRSQTHNPRVSIT